MTKNDFYYQLDQVKISYSPKQMKQLEIFYQLLIAENKLYNLTALTSEEDVYEKHFFDSLIITKFIDFNEKRVLDIGSGAGFPGIIIALFTLAEVVLLDSNNKKINFLNKVITSLELTNVTAVCQRAEKFSLSNKEQFDIIISRALAHLSIFLEIAIQAAKINSYLIALKGKNYQAEISANALSLLKCQIEKIEQYNLPNGADRTLLKIKKMAPSNFKTRDYSAICKRKL